MRPANKERRYVVTQSRIGWAHSQKDPWTHGEISTIIFTYEVRFVNTVSNGNATVYTRGEARV